MQTAIQFSEPSLNIFRNHYLKKSPNGELLEKTPDDVFRRVSEFYQKHGVPTEIAEAMRELQSTKQFSFNSPVYYNGDVDNERPQLLACFVSNLQDSMDSITDHLTRACTIFKTGAGMGFNIGSLRPTGASIGDGGRSKSGQSGSSGPMSFMKLFQAAGDTVMSAGKRRAAMWAGMRYDHPDAMDFIKCKRGTGRLQFTNMNISLIVDDQFLLAWENNSIVEFNWNGVKGGPWGSANARDLMSAVVESVWLGGDPGLMFIDVINRHNTTPTYGQIVCFNPCGEIALPPDTSCNLGAVVVYNVLRFLENGGVIKRDPHTRTFEWKSCREYVLAQIGGIAKTAMAHLDANIDINNYPDDLFALNTKEIRPTGLGLSGLGEAFCALGVSYGSSEAVQIGAEIMNEITYAATEWSFDAAKRLGPCPASNLNDAAMKEQLLHYFRHCDRLGLKKSAERWRLLAKQCKPGSYRNSYVSCIAPTGNTGIAFDAGSGGMEPIPAIAYSRNTRDGVLYFADQEFEIQVGHDPAMLEDIIDAFGGSIFRATRFENADKFLESLNPATVNFLNEKYDDDRWKSRIRKTWNDIRENVPDETIRNFLMMHDIQWKNRIQQQEALQCFTSLSISSTINVPNETTADEIRDIYLEAFRGGLLKGVTIYRDGSIEFAPMTMTKNTKDALPDTMPSTASQDTEQIRVAPKDEKTTRVAADKAAKKTEYQSVGGETEYGDVVVRRKIKRPCRTTGDTLELEFSDGIHNDKFYITVNEDKANPGHPIEVFVSGGKHGENTPALNQAIGRLISGWLQDGAPVRSIVKKLIGIKGDQRALVRFYPNDERPTRVTSIPDAIGRMLQRDYMDRRQVLSVPNGVMCPKCYHNTFVYSADGTKCWKCHNPDCGESLC